MRLLERENYLERLQNIYKDVKSDYGHTVFVFGEAGIGKTSLINVFTQSQSDTPYIYQGACDSLFTPRPLGPLYDISNQIGESFTDVLNHEKDRIKIFPFLLKEIQDRSLPVIIVFEDIHWADEATVDLIKYLSRRIRSTRCMFILSCRDHDTQDSGPFLRQILTEIPPNTFSRLRLEPLSKDAVDHWAGESGYTGEDIYKLTNGNPFFVSEILSGHGGSIPENIKDTILKVYFRQEENVKDFLDSISIHPNRIETWILEEMDNDFLKNIEACITSSILRTDGDFVYFKHDLYRKIIEETINPIKRKYLHKEVLDVMVRHPEHKIEKARLVHFALNAEDKEKISKYAPQAASEAANLGSHREAATFYKMAIEIDDQNESTVVSLYEKYAYECYLTNQIKEAISISEISLTYFQKSKNPLKKGNTLRFLSRLWWLDGHREKAEDLARQSIETLENGFPTRERAQAYSNYAQLMMLAYHTNEAVEWAGKAIVLAEKLIDIEIVCHALNNMGTAQLHQPENFSEGIVNLRKSLKIGLTNGFHEHVARAYTNLSSAQIYISKYKEGYEYLNEGIKYCEDRDLDSWTYYMLSWKALAELDMGNWLGAEEICDKLLSNPIQSIVKIGTMVVKFTLNVRRGNRMYAALLHEAREMAIKSGELQRIIPVISAYAEYFWLYKEEIPSDIMDKAVELLKKTNDPWSLGKFIFWMKKCGIDIKLDQVPLLPEMYEQVWKGNWKEAGKLWKNRGNQYYYALCLMEGNIQEKKEALLILKHLETNATEEKLKKELRESGVRTIPRGPRKTTRQNLAQLTIRQIEVLLLIKEGYSNHEIAEQLFVSRKTIDHHVSAILGKLGVNSRNKAIKEAIHLGIIK